MTAIILFFIGHWFLSLMYHTVFLHRYSSHAMFTMSRFWERVFFVFTWLAQGSSFLIPRAYAIMHRRHHQYSDTDKDPHSPYNYSNVISMMIATYREYNYIKNHRVPEDFDTGGYPRPPEWPRFEKIAGNPAVRIVFILAYAGFYIAFAPSPWWFLLIPIHVLMGPIHGAIVNWCGHKYGYINYTETGDRSRNTLPVDILMMGELFQNNHHRTPDKAGFAHKFYEFDPTYIVVRLLSAIKIIHLPQTAR
ncbi:MAG: acyl-CoA desaturase [candidate division Zixibacteria bacterium]|nr:acyl-CoA desaturase [candidate division Zixibacteria bacterium]